MSNYYNIMAVKKRQPSLSLLLDLFPNAAVDYQVADDFFYIIFDESIRDILGEPIEFEVR